MLASIIPAMDKLNNGLNPQSKEVLEKPRATHAGNKWDCGWVWANARGCPKVITCIVLYTR
jgi:hypothetical protein